LSLNLEHFTDGYRLQSEELIRSRNRWLTAGGVLDSFSGLERRIILRDTRVYAAIQRQQLQPESLKDSLSQAMILEQMARTYLLDSKRPLLWPVFAAERRQLQQLDIPFFTHLIDRDTLKLGDEENDLFGLVTTSGLESAKLRLIELDAAEVAFQEQLICGCIRAHHLRSSDPNMVAVVNNDTGYLLAHPHAPKAENQHPGISKEYEAALLVANDLLSLAIVDGQGIIEWLGIDMEIDGESFTFGPVGTTLYGGTIGIALLLQSLESKGLYPYSTSVLNGMSHESIVAGILRPLQDLTEDGTEELRLRWWRDQALGLAGCGGILLGLRELGMHALIEKLMASARIHYLQDDQGLDILKGCAGLIGALLQNDDDFSLSLAVIAGRKLVCSQRDDGGWPDPSTSLGLLGFSHGTAGYSAALAALHNITGEKEFKSSASAAITYERHCFNPERGNWPDRRNGITTYPTAWCHGAAGIALGRACLWGTELWDEYCIEEIQIALQTTITVLNGGLATDHLCCGSLGLVALLRLLINGPWPLRKELVECAQSSLNTATTHLIDRCLSDPSSLRCFGTRDGSLSLPGFFTGLSGIAMVFLDSTETNSQVNNLMSAGLMQPTTFLRNRITLMQS
jgi:type 2 lantibiotic biosynthesis protein LanM